MTICRRPGRDIVGIETKSGATLGSDAFTSLDKVAATIPELRARLVVYGGDESWTSRGARAVPFATLDTIAWTTKRTRTR